MDPSSPLPTRGLQLFRTASAGHEQDEPDVMEEELEETVEVTVRGAGLRKTKLELPFTTTLDALKQQLSEISGLPVERVELVHSGRTVNDRGGECIGNVVGTKAKLLLKRGPPVKCAPAAAARAPPAPPAAAADDELRMALELSRQQFVADSSSSATEQTSTTSATAPLDTSFNSLEISSVKRKSEEGTIEGGGEKPTKVAKKKKKKKKGGFDAMLTSMMAPAELARTISGEQRRRKDAHQKKLRSNLGGGKFDKLDRI